MPPFAALSTNTIYYCSYSMIEGHSFYKSCLSTDLTESSLPKWLFEVGSLYLHGYDKEGHKICKLYLPFHVFIRFYQNAGRGFQVGN